MAFTARSCTAAVVGQVCVDPELQPHCVQLVCNVPLAYIPHTPSTSRPCTVVPIIRSDMNVACIIGGTTVHGHDVLGYAGSNPIMQCGSEPEDARVGAFQIIARGRAAHLIPCGNFFASAWILPLASRRNCIDPASMLTSASWACVVVSSSGEEMVGCDGSRISKC